MKKIYNEIMDEVDEQSLKDELMPIDTTILSEPTMYREKPSKKVIK